MPKSLGDGHEKIAVLTEEPAIPTAPTLTELNAGIDAAESILASDWTFTAADSDKISEPAVGDLIATNVLGRSNFSAGMTVFREFDASTHEVDLTEDALYQAAKAKGTSLWIYVRKIGKPASAAWANLDEIRLGMEVLTDEPQVPSDQGGFIKARVPLEPQAGWPNIAAHTG